MTCSNLQRLVQALSTSFCFVSNFEIGHVLDLNKGITWPLRNHHAAAQHSRRENPGLRSGGSPWRLRKSGPSPWLGGKTATGPCRPGFSLLPQAGEGRPKGRMRALRELANPSPRAVTPIPTLPRRRAKGDRAVQAWLFPSPARGRRWPEGSDEGAPRAGQSVPASGRPHPNPSPARGGRAIGPCASGFVVNRDVRRTDDFGRLCCSGAEPADKPGSVVDSHSSRRSVTATLEQPTRTRRGQRHEVPIWSCSRWGLPCRPVARLAVRSYRTISPLPDPAAPKNTRPSAVSFCCTFRRLAPPRRYLAPCPVEPGLSSASPATEIAGMTRLSGRLRRAHSRTIPPAPRRS